MDYQQIELSNAIAGIIMNADYSFFSNDELIEMGSIDKNSTVVCFCQFNIIVINNKYLYFT